MGKYKKLSHVIYKCDYHILWVLKYRLRIYKGAVKELTENDVRMLCEWKSCEVLELNVQRDLVHLVVGSSQAFDFQGDGDLEGEDSDKAVQGLSQVEEEALTGEPYLDQGLFRQHNRCGRGDD